MNLKAATLEFLANEFRLEPRALTPDTSFVGDLGVTGEQLTDLLQHLQEALNIILPEDKVEQLATVGQLLDLVNDEDAD